MMDTVELAKQFVTTKDSALFLCEFCLLKPDLYDNEIIPLVLMQVIILVMKNIDVLDIIHNMEPIMDILMLNGQMTTHLTIVPWHGAQHRMKVYILNICLVICDIVFFHLNTIKIG